MNAFSPILAQGGNAALADAWGVWAALSTDVRNQLLMVGACTLLILALLIWAAFFRKSKKRRHRVHRPHRWETESGERSSRRHRRRHRKHSGEQPPRNPTLAETGGLPPIRSEPPPPPAPPVPPTA